MARNNQGPVPELVRCSSNVLIQKSLQVAEAGTKSVIKYSHLQNWASVLINLNNTDYTVIVRYWWED